MFEARGPIARPAHLDRIIVHQFDAGRPSPGGIDTCIRGILKFASGTQEIGVVGVDTGSGPDWRKLGEWEHYQANGHDVYFLPVARLDPADQSRRVPHSVRLVAGALRFRQQLPGHDNIQAHRADVGAGTRFLSGAPLTYFIHTQESGLTGSTSDSFWRRASSVHERLEKAAIARASRVAVFNPDYGAALAKAHPHVRPFPTWFDPELIDSDTEHTGGRVLWVGRLETPKDPLLAIQAFADLRNRDDRDWSLDVLGSGTLLADVKESAANVPGVNVHGRVAPAEVAALMARSDVFLMTSHPGYEGFPRVLVEAMANGLKPVVTEGSDTGSLVEPGIGFVTDRRPSTIANAISDTAGIDRATVIGAVRHLSAPAIVEALYEEDWVNSR